MLPTYPQTRHDVSQPSVDSSLMPTRGTLLQILVERVGHSIVGKELPPHLWLLISVVRVLASASSERLSGLV